MIRLLAGLALLAVMAESLPNFMTHLKDINECEGGNQCDYYADCENEIGTYTCACREGFVDKGTMGYDCEDIDECVDHCRVNAVCTNTIGSFKCRCADGYAEELGICKDIDECANEAHSCVEHSQCTNTNGSYTCDCREGYDGEGRTSCTNINECGVSIGGPCHAEAHCTDLDGTYKCDCKTGFTGTGKNCTDLDECVKAPCSPNGWCRNAYGSYFCECFEGFIGNGWICEDIDECSEARFYCDSNADCQNGHGDYTCACKSGYEGDGRVCIDVNECAKFPCDTNAECDNTEGTFTCTCFDGTFGDGFYCQDTDECQQSPCTDHSTCVNGGPNGFRCNCNNGFEGNGLISCTDVNECLSGTSSCHPNAACNNDMGSYKCNCDEGFTGDGWECEDIDECNGAPCDENAYCDNLSGSFSCTCEDAFKGDGFQCEQKRVYSSSQCGGNCDPNAICKRSGTSDLYFCTCPAGFIGDGLECEDVDECDQYPCSANGTCSNSPGSYVCSCNDGLYGDGVTCVETVCADESRPEIGLTVTNDITNPPDGYVLCATDYELSGNVAATCNVAEKSWNFSATCQPPACEGEADKANGMKILTNGDGSTGQIICMNGYKLNGESAAHCVRGTETNYWRHSGHCSTACATEQRPLNYLEITPDNNRPPNGTIICFEGYTLASSSPEQAICTTNTGTPKWNYTGYCRPSTAPKTGDDPREGDDQTIVEEVIEEQVGAIERVLTDIIQVLNPFKSTSFKLPKDIETIVGNVGKAFRINPKADPQKPTGTATSGGQETKKIVEKAVIDNAQKKVKDGVGTPTRFNPQ